MKTKIYNAEYLTALYIKSRSNPSADWLLDDFAVSVLTNQLQCEEIDILSLTKEDDYLSWTAFAFYKDESVQPYIELRYYIQGKQKGLCQMIIDIENQDDTIEVLDIQKGAKA